MGIKGGRRPGAGRKKGSRNKETLKRVDIAAKALDSGITPLDYLLDVMRKPIPDDAEAALKVVMIGQRFEAAKAAAPYVHPRLAALELKNNGANPFGGFTNAELRMLTQAALERLREIDVTPKPAELPAPDAKH